MSWEIDLAKQFKNRDNINPMEPQLGEVISIDPLKISIFGNKVILYKENCYICSSLIEKYKRKADCKIDKYTAKANAIDSNNDTIETISVETKEDYNIEITFKEVLKKGDKVLCLPTSKGQKFFIIDKVV